MIEGVVGITIWTDDLDRMLLFYRDTLGLTPYSVNDGWVSFRWADMHLNLGVHSQVSGKAQDPHRIMINLGTQEIHEAYRHHTAQGVEFVRPPEQEHWGGWVATFLDVDGNILQLLQQP